MTVSKKIKTIANKIKQNKRQYNLDRQTGKILALSSKNVGKFEFLVGKDFLPEKDLLEKAAAIKTFEYSSLDSELKKQTGIAKDQYKCLKDRMSDINSISRKDDVRRKRMMK